MIIWITWSYAVKSKSNNRQLVWKTLLTYLCQSSQWDRVAPQQSQRESQGLPHFIAEHSTAEDLGDGQIDVFSWMHSTKSEQTMYYHWHWKETLSVLQRLGSRRSSLYQSKGTCPVAWSGVVSCLHSSIWPNKMSSRGKGSCVLHFSFKWCHIS